MLNHIAGRLQRVPKTQMRRISGQDGSGGRRRGTIKHRAARTGAAIRKYGRGQNLEEFREAGNIVGRHGAADDRLILDPQSGRARRRRDIGRGRLGRTAFEIGAVDDDALEARLGDSRHILSGQLGCHRKIGGKCVDRNGHEDLLRRDDSNCASNLPRW